MASLTANGLPDPRATRRLQLWFALRFVAFAIPLFAIYTFPYEENGISERWFSSYLSGYARLAGGALALIEPGVRVSGQDISGRYSLRIIKSCDAMEAVILLGSAVLAFPVAWRKRLLGLVLGTLTIVAVNVVRICSLYYIGVSRPAQFEFFHIEVWPLVVVAAAGMAFFSWLTWATKAES